MPDIKSGPNFDSTNMEMVIIPPTEVEADPSYNITGRTPEEVGRQLTAYAEAAGFDPSGTDDPRNVHANGNILRGKFAVIEGHKDGNAPGSTTYAYTVHATLLVRTLENPQTGEVKQQHVANPMENQRRFVVVEPGDPELPTIALEHSLQRAKAVDAAHNDPDKLATFRADAGDHITAYATKEGHFGAALELTFPGSERHTVARTAQLLEQGYSPEDIAAVVGHDINNTDQSFMQVVVPQAASAVLWAKEYFPGIPAGDVISMLYLAATKNTTNSEYVPGYRVGPLASYGHKNDGSAIHPPLWGTQPPAFYYPVDNLPAVV